MAFPPEFLDELRARVGLVGLIGRRVKLVRRGREHTGLCPFHNEKTPSFTVSEDKGFYHCFGCGAHGDVIGFAMQTEGLSFPEAVEKLAAEAGLAVPRMARESPEAGERRERLLACLEAATGWYEEQLAAVGGVEARGYLERRGLGDGTVGAFRLGFAPSERGRLRQALKARGFADDLLAEAGLIKLPEADGEGPPGGAEPRDYLFNRVVFPIEDQRGRVVAFGGRTLGDAKAKYLNSPDGPLFHKGRLLYNWARAREAARGGAELLVVEGYMDVIALAEAGLQAAVAPLGTALTEEQIALLWRLADEPVLCLDGDAAGQRAAARAAERALPLLEPGKSLRFALLPAGEDPDSLVRARGAVAMRRVLDGALPMVELLWQQATRGRRFETPERRAGLRRHLRQSVGRIRDPEVREAYWDEMEGRFEEAFRGGGRSRRDAGPGGFRDAASSARFGAGSWGNRGGWGGGATAWRPKGPTPKGPPPKGLPDVSVPPVVRPRPSSLAAQRQEQVLLAALINHPRLLHDAAEQLADLQLENSDLAELLAALLDFAAQAESLDSEAVHSHLCQRGSSDIVAGLLRRRVYHLGPFARPDAAPAEVRDAWGPFLARFGERRAQGETREAARRLSEDMSEENLNRLQVTQRLGRAGAD